MQFQEELRRLCYEVEQYMVTYTYLFCPDADNRFITKKNEILSILRMLYGENSREFKVVYSTSLPVTVVKVLKHVIKRRDVHTRNNVLANVGVK